MDLGIKGRTALVCGSSQGLGFACAEALAREGVQVILNGRDATKLQAAAARIGANARWIVADQTTDAGRAALIEGAGEIDILVNNNAGPPPGSWRTGMTRQYWEQSTPTCCLPSS